MQDKLKWNAIGLVKKLYYEINRLTKEGKTKEEILKIKLIFNV